MSFSSDLKKELMESIPKSIHCRNALLAGVLSINGRVESFNDSDVLVIRVENDDFETFVLKLLRITLDIPEASVLSSNEKMHHRKLIIKEIDQINKLESRLKISYSESRICIGDMVTERSCCKSAFLKGTFLAGGSLSSPEKSNHMEISVPTEHEADKLCRILGSLELPAKRMNRNDRYIVYIKDGNTISNSLGVMGASVSMLNYENIRVVKDIRNNINREVNCDAANMAKTANAAARQIEDIKLVISHIKPEDMPDGLKEMAEIRLEFPYLSLKELGDKFTPPLGKSGINHRLKKISAMAENIRKSNGIQKGEKL